MKEPKKKPIQIYLENIFIDSSAWIDLIRPVETFKLPMSRFW
jgi:hypothetical protein